MRTTIFAFASAVLCATWLQVSPESAAQSSATVKGRVASFEGDHALPGALVTLNGPQLARAKTVVTNQRGQFEFAGVPEGTFYVEALKPAFVPMRFGASRAGRPGAPIKVSKSMISEITIRLPLGGVITGTVTMSDGQPVSEAVVHAVLQSGAAAGDPMSFLAVTDDRGRYRVYGLWPGRYVVGVTHGMIGVAEGFIQRADSDMERRLVQLARRSGGGALLAIQPPVAPNFSTFAPTFFPGTANPSDAAPIDVGVGEERVADVVLKPTRVGSLAGIVDASSGSSLPSVEVRLELVGPRLPSTLFRYFTSSLGPSPSGRSFQFSHVSPGDYILLARAPVANSSKTFLWDSARVSSTGSSLGGLVLSLRPSSTLSGRIRLDGDWPDAATALGRISIELTPIRTGSTMRVRWPPSPSKVAASGQFKVEGVTAGEYLLTVSGAGQAFVRSVEINGRDFADRPLAFTAGTENAAAVLTLSRQSASLSGRLLGATLTDASAFNVIVFSADPDRRQAGTSRVVTVRPAADGQYVVPRLPPGRYLVAALFDFDPEDLYDTSFFNSIVPFAVEVILDAARDTRMDLQIVGR